MTFVDFLRGAGNVLIILVIAGAVAYVGDRVGHQVGRRRLTLFGIRPRYTSTIVAVATGVIIALVVTLIAILASQQVKTAFFRLSALNAQIMTLTQQEQQLEQKVRTGRLVLPLGQLITPLRLILTQSETPAEQEAALRTFYAQAVRYMNQTYAGEHGLKPYVVPRDIDTRLSTWLNDSRIQSELVRSNVMLTTVTDQNLFVNDPIHFAISPVPDVRTFAKGQFIANLRVPGNGEADIALAVRELDAEVTTNAVLSGMPPFLAIYVQPTELVPGPQAMQQMLQHTGTYDLVAYAADDIYPHTFGVYVVIALVPQKGR
jgi:hypothetical protein